MATNHIAIAGNIGSGKTTLTRLLAHELGWEPHYENPDSNPYISDFYGDMKRWGFNMQVHFLYSRIAKVRAIRDGRENAVQDRTIYEDVYIFAPTLLQMGLMSERDFVCYSNLFGEIRDFIQPPDLLIYLRGSVSTLVERIQRRNREYEQSVRLDYLQSLNQRYEQWIAAYKLGPLQIYDIDHLNFIEEKGDLQSILKGVNGHFNGLF